MKTQPVHKAWEIFKTAARNRALGELPEYLLYHSPLRFQWAKLRGHRFHRSSIVYFMEKDGIHTRVVLLLPRLRHDYPGLESADLELQFFSETGQRLALLRREQIPLTEPLVLDSAKLPPDFKLEAPFEGSLWILERLPLDEDLIFKRDGLFGSTHTYIDYYREGDFVTTLHDYCAYLPDQAIQTAQLGMIPAVADEEKETLLIFHAARNGIGPVDLEVILVNPQGKRRSRMFPALGPYRFRKVFLSDFFEDAKGFLEGGIGQVMVRGLFRCLLRRMAYGIFDKRTGRFSMDHCYYSLLERNSFYRADERKRFPKGWFNPFIVMANPTTNTTAHLFHAREESGSKSYDLLLYDHEGRLVLKRKGAFLLSGDAVQKIDFGALLEEEGISGPFLGHAELLYLEDPRKDFYEKDLDVNVEYCSNGRAAQVIFGSDVWNGPNPVGNPDYRSICRVICNEFQTTLIGISNCSFDYDYKQVISFTLSLVGGAKVLATKRLSLGPHATCLLPVDEVFPEARHLLRPFGGVGYTATTDITGSVLTHLFFTKDRTSGALSVEHSLDL